MCYVIRYEESQLHDSIYQLHVKLLGADKNTVISEHTVNPTEQRLVYSHEWKEVRLSFLCHYSAQCCIPAFQCTHLSWPAGVTCVLRLWTRREICPLLAPTEEQLPKWFPQYTVHWQCSDCTTKQKQPVG